MKKDLTTDRSVVMIYTDVLRYFPGLVKQPSRQVVPAEDDPEVMELVSKHLRQFFRCYQRSAR